jgi:hypothetical protein
MVQAAYISDKPDKSEVSAAARHHGGLMGHRGPCHGPTRQAGGSERLDISSFVRLHPLLYKAFLPLPRRFNIFHLDER